MAAPIAAGILAAAQLFQGLMGAAAQRKREKDELIYKGIASGLETKKQAYANLAQGQQGSLEDIIANYRGVTRG